VAIGENFDIEKGLEYLGRLPTPARFGIMGGIALVIVALYWLTIFGGQRTVLDGVEEKLAKLEQDIQSAKAVASNLESFKRKREELKKELQASLQKLPNSSELPALLTDITSLGKKSGLEIRSFKRGKQVNRGFYNEQRILLEFFGGYHDVGVFFDRLANLSRIVNIDSLNVSVASDGVEGPKLKVKGVAATFYFTEPETAGGE